MLSDTLIVIMILFIIIIAYRIYLSSDSFQLKCIIASVDGERYCVRERSMQKEAANHLALVNKNMKKLASHCQDKFPEKENVVRLVEGFNPKQIVEILPTSQYTAYSENKGEKLAFCLNKKKDGDNLIDMNTLTFVAIHEMSHIATKEIGHTPTFWKNFKFLLIEAEKINIYKPINYEKEPKNYCGLEINHNPYYD